MILYYDSLKIINTKKSSSKNISNLELKDFMIEFRRYNLNRRFDELIRIFHIIYFFRFYKLIVYFYGDFCRIVAQID